MMPLLLSIIATSFERMETWHPKVTARSVSGSCQKSLSLLWWMGKWSTGPRIFPLIFRWDEKICQRRGFLYDTGELRISQVKDLHRLSDDLQSFQTGGLGMGEVSFSPEARHHHASHLRWTPWYPVRHTCTLLVHLHISLHTVIHSHSCYTRTLLLYTQTLLLS